MIVGEHGDSEVAVWSATSVGGLIAHKLLRQMREVRRPQHGQARIALHEQVKNAAYEIIQKKGATFYAVALAVSRIVSAIFNDENSVLTVSTYLENEFDGLLQDVYLSLPVVVNAQGAEKILRPDYSEGEKGAIISSGLALKEKLKDLPL
jgi:L-lactate dehydrogenase